MITIAIFVLALASQGLVSVQSADVDATAVCEDKASILNKSGLEAVTAQLEAGAKCSEDAKQAIFALDDIVSKSSNDVCSIDSVNMIEEFAQTHIYSGHQLPHSIKWFALSYFMQVSHACKDLMINVFTHELDSLLKSGEHIDINQMVEGGEMIDELVSQAASKGEVILPSAMAELLAGADTIEDSMEINPAQKEAVHKIREVCNDQLQPIYQGLVKPIVVLAKAGIEYPNADTLKEFSITEEQRKKLNRITAIINMCESIEVYRDHDDSDEIKHVELKPQAKVSIDEIEPMSADVLQKLLDDSQAEREQLRNNLRDAILAVLKKEFDVDDAGEFRAIIVCTKITVVFEPEDGLEAPSDEHKPVACGRGKSSMSPVAMVGLAMLIAIAASTVVG